jgi:hypothetical protein
MSKRVASFLVLGSMIAAGAFAAFQTRASSGAAAPSAKEPEIATFEPTPAALPPDHPPIDAPHAHGTAMTASPEEGAAIAWSAPVIWRSVPNVSSMRLATYRTPRVRGESDEGELSVTRAGGTTEANVERWTGQFDGSSTEAREERTVQGFKVTVVSIKGTFLGGDMMQGTPSAPRPSWALLGAIVETPGSPYFFKLLGPVGSVSAARAPFDAMIAGLTRL